MSKRKDELLHMFNTLTPDQLLKEVYMPDEPPQYQLELIDQVQEDCNLPMPVFNVLIHYTLGKYYHSLPQLQLMQVAARWMRIGVDSASKAIKYAQAQELYEEALNFHKN